MEGRLFITLGKPRSVRLSDQHVMMCDLTFSDGYDHNTANGNIRTLWYSVPEEYGKYLTSDRIDAFLALVLPCAMKDGYDIYCEAPCSETLLHNIEKCLLPPLVKNNKHFSKINIECGTLPDFVSSGAVGTGISLGVDSAYAIDDYHCSKFKSFKLTHLCNISCGGAYSRSVFNEMELLSDELGLPLINITSNSLNVFRSQFFHMHHSFYNLSSVLALGKLFSRYFYASSGYGADSFSFTEPTDYDCCLYDPAIASSFSTPGLRFYSQGFSNSRKEKLLSISDSLVKNHLNCCWNISITRAGGHCGWCDKCMRTMAILETMGILSKYCSVFDVQEYDKFNKIYIMNTIVKKNSPYYKEPYEFYKTNYPELFKQAKEDLSKPENKGISILQYAVESGSLSAYRLLIGGLTNGRLGGLTIKQDVEQAIELAEDLYMKSSKKEDRHLLIRSLFESKEKHAKRIVELYVPGDPADIALIVAKSLDASNNRKACIDLLRNYDDDECRRYLSSRLKYCGKNNHKESIDILEGLSRKGDLDSVGALALEYYKGDIVAKDVGKAITLMNSAVTKKWCRRYLIEWLLYSNDIDCIGEASLLCKFDLDDSNVRELYQSSIEMLKSF